MAKARARAKRPAVDAMEAALRREAETRIFGRSCLGCVEPHASTLRRYMETALARRVPTSGPILYRLVRDASSFHQTEHSLKRHIELHEIDLWAQLKAAGLVKVR